MGGGQKINIPDWKIYRPEGIPELEALQKMLAARGLKDPWIRNEVWRYTPENYGGELRNAAKSLGRGFKWAVAAMTVTILGEMIYHKVFTIHTDHDEHSHSRPTH